MDIYQLRTFVAVARAGSITRASEVLHLSQPAVSAHIKAIEDAVGLALFERTSRGMSLTREGERLLARADATLAAHQGLMDEATRLKGRLAGTLHLGAGNANTLALGRLIANLAARSPDVAVVVTHGTSVETLAGIRDASLDAGFYNEAGEPEPDLATTEVAQFGICLVAPPGLVAAPLDWRAIAALPWIYPASSACCGRTAERLFKAHQFRPTRVISVDREDVTRTLIAGGTGVGLLHDDTARAAQARGEVDLVFLAPDRVRVLFAHLASRADDPLLRAVTAVLRAENPA